MRPFLIPSFGTRSEPCGTSLHVLLALVLLLSGCFAPRFRPSGDAVTGAEAALVCRELLSRHAQVSSMRALVDATVSRSSESAAFRYVILSRGSDQFRIDMLPQEGAFTLGILVVKDGRTVLLDAQEKTYSTASDEAELLEAFLGLEGVTRSVIVGLVTGILPPIDCSSARVYRESGGYVSIADGTSQVVWHISPQSFLVKGVHILDRGGRRVQISGERETRAESSGLATVRLAIFKPLEAQAEMLVKKLSIDPPLSESLFAVAIPPSYSER